MFKFKKIWILEGIFILIATGLFFIPFNVVMSDLAKVTIILLALIIFTLGAFLENIVEKIKESAALIRIGTWLKRFWPLIVWITLGGGIILLLTLPKQYMIPFYYASLIVAAVFILIILITPIIRKKKQKK